MVAKKYVMEQKQPKYQLDKSFYDKVRAAKPQYKLVDKFELPPFRGRGFHMTKGQSVRFVTVEGPQVGDVAFWNTHNTDEIFSATRTWVIEGFVINVGTRLWSQTPWLRPMATCIEDTVVVQPPYDSYHHSDARSHCTTEEWEMTTGIPGLNSCHVNLLEAIEPFGLNESNIGDNIMVHQKTTVDPKKGGASVTKGDSKPGDYIEFYAEMDVLVALSVCPIGDGTRVVTPTGQAHPLGVEIYDTGFEPLVFPGFTDWRPNWKGKWLPS